MTDDPVREAAQAYASRNPVAWPIRGSVIPSGGTSSGLCMACGRRIHSVNDPSYPSRWIHTGNGQTRCTPTGPLGRL